MLLAMKSDRRLILANDADLHWQYYCPCCGERVILRHGSYKIAHFAHQKGSNCGFSEGETREHLRGKRQLLIWAQKRGYCPQLEVYLPAIQQRPDLLLQVDGRRIALEFQCSPLSLARLRERNQGYRQLKIKPLWLLGAPYCHRLHRSKAAQFAQPIDQQLAVPYWNTATSSVWYDRQYYQVSFAAKRLKTIDLLKVQTKQLERWQAAFPTKKIRQLALMGQSQPMFLCPLVCHDCLPSWPVTRQPLIFWRIGIVKYLNQLPLFTSWSLNGWRRLLIKASGVEWLAFGCLPTSKVQALVCSQFTADLLKAGIILKVSSGYVLMRHVCWFRSVAMKYAEIESARHS